MDRVAGLISLALIVVFVFPVLLKMVPDPKVHWTVAVALGLVLIGVSLIAILDKAPSLFRRWRRFVELGSFSRVLRRVLFQTRATFGILACGLVLQLLFVGSVYLLTLALHVEVSIAQCAIVVPLSLLVAAVPVSLAGWGIREGAMVTLLGYFDVAWTDALTLSVLFGLLVILAGLPGGIVWIVTGGAKPVMHPDEDPERKSAVARGVAG